MFRREILRHVWLLIGALAFASNTQALLAEVCLVRDGKINAVVVTSDKPSPVAAYAAEELVNHVLKSTGQKLPVAIETSIPDQYPTRIFIGVCEAAKKQGIDADSLAIEEFVLRSIGNDLYIVGKELLPEQYQGTRPRYSEPWNPLAMECVHSGTLLGAYEILDQVVGVRWLWPGELGTYVPRHSTIVVPAMDSVTKPKLLYRNVGGWDLPQIFLTGSYFGRRIPRDYRVGGFTKEYTEKLIFASEDAGYMYGRAVEVFHRRHHRVTQIEEPRAVIASHLIAGVNDMWAKYGQTHPEWFAMRADGTRGLKVPRAGAWTPLCVSNTDLHHCIVEQDWDGGDVLTLGEADAAGESMCYCPNCRAWDGPETSQFPEDLRALKYTPHAMGDRYAKFWKSIYDLAVKRNPNVRISGYLYHNTLPAPTSDVKLSQNIFGEFVIYGARDGWYPMSREEDQWYRDQWQGWAKTGISLTYGPNYLLNNYVTPNVTTRQSGEFFRMAYQHRLVGTNFRSYAFSWAAHGPMAYMHHRLQWRPDLEIDTIREEYFAGFGPAAAMVRNYFDYWEKYAATRPAIRDLANDPRGALERLKRIRGHYLAYPPEVYVPAEAMLTEALEIARKDPSPEFAERVQFLQAGVKHARLATKLQDFLDFESPSSERGSVPTDPERLKSAQRVMQRLIQFRHDPKNLFVSDYMSNATVEKNQIIGIEVLFQGKEAVKGTDPEDDVF